MLDAALTVVLTMLILCPYFLWLHWLIDHPRRVKAPASERNYLTAEDRSWLMRHEALARGEWRDPPLPPAPGTGESPTPRKVVWR